MGRLVAFVGPSLPASEALRLVPEVELRPPICQGDLSTEVERDAPDGVLIVDGEFGQSLSVWHKEILGALHRGVRVVGASSMGALRAAELERFGMEGVGEIYAHYRDGWLTSDADVALLYDEDYAPVTWPLVNVRATIAALRARGLLDEEEAAAVDEAAARVHFTERGPRTIARELELLGADGALAAQLADAYVDQKALDAVAGFERLARLDELPRPAAEAPLHRDGRGYGPLLSSDVTVRRPAGSLRRYQLVADVALHQPDYDALLGRALDRALIAGLGHEFGVEPDADAIAEQRARTLARLELTEATLAEWLAANDLDAERFDELVAQEAAITHMRRWLLDTRLYERNRRLVIEQLQLEGGYVEAANAAARRRALADARPTPPYPSTQEAIADVLVRQMSVSAWKPGRDLARFADEQGFDSLGGLLVALSDSAAAGAERQERRARVARMLGLDGPAAVPEPAARTHALLEAHQVTQVLLTAVELGVPAALADGPRTTSELAAATGTDAGRLARLLRALRAAGMVTGEWELTEQGRALAPAGPGDEATLAAYAEHVRGATFEAWAGLADVIRGADPPPYPVDEGSDRLVSAATGALGLVDAIVASLDPPHGARVADVGGGLGDVAAALKLARPDLDIALVELPDTAARARPRLGDDVEVVAFTGEPLARPADVCLLARVIVTLADEPAVELLRFARGSLRPGGRLDVVEPRADGTAAAAFGDLLNLARSGGAVRDTEAWEALARRAGLRVVARSRLTSPFTHLRLEPL